MSTPLILGGGGGENNLTSNNNNSTTIPISSTSTSTNTTTTTTAMTSAAALSVVPSPRPSRPGSPITAFTTSTTTSLPSTAALGTPIPSTAAAFRPLNVRDALQYLDRVKQQFSAEFEVYGKFLTIMKDFKTQNIDTPGVIDRVSTLFRGHPSLIQGFNTFLPPGYRIECVVTAPSEAGASNTITVTTPMGVTIRTQDVTGLEAMEFVRNQPRSEMGTSSSTPNTPQQPPRNPLASPSVSSSGLAGKESIGGNKPYPPPSLPDHLPALPALPALPLARPASPSVVAIPPYRGPSSKSTVPSQSSSLAGPPRSAFVSDSYPTIPPQHQPNLPALPLHSSSSNSNSTSGVIPRPRIPSPELLVSKTKKAEEAAAEAAKSALALDGQSPVMEFNHAINYVNKIKNRFTKDPETYKTFLEILQTYQKETRPIQEVYTQVTALFHGAPDLLDEFKAFLPDTTDHPTTYAPSTSRAGGNPSTQKKKVSKEDSRNSQQQQQQHQQHQQQQQQKPPAEEKKKRAAPGMGERAKAKRAKTNHAHLASPPPAAILSSKPDRNTNQHNGLSLNGHSHNTSEAVASASYHSQPYGAPPPGFPGAPRMQSAYDSYLAHHRAPTLVQSEEFGFFDRVKKYVDDRATWTEFLKLLNLFTQEIIDVATLLEKSLVFIGGNDELVGAFKDLVGWDPVVDGRIEGEDWIIDNEPVLERPKVELHSMKAFGPSYRKLPDSEIDLACSGRDALDWSVLNDEWVAFATWASEGSGAHRKNIYEDALYNSEQERHWYSFQIESNLRTIAHFEPIAARIVLMNSEERNLFRLEDGFGGESPSIYERIVRKIWGKDQGYEILGALYDNPSVAVPIVLSRLKQKDEEWKRAEREWNKVWREVDAKNFYRALDHQSIPFKAIDKKVTTTSKSLTTEIETLRREKQRKVVDRDLAAPPLRPLHQFEFGMPDRDVLFDVLKLCFSFLDRDQSGTSAPERARVEAFLRLFVPLLFGVPHSDMEANLAHSDEVAENEEEEGESELGGGGGSDAEAEARPSPSSSAKNGINKRGGAADLRRRLLTHAATAARNLKGGGGESLENSGDEPTGPIILEEQTWIQLSEAKDGLEMDCDTPAETRRYHFFANSTLYCLVRILQTIYHRLLDFKKLVAEFAEIGVRRLSPLAVDLGLSTPVPTIDQGDNPAAHYYEHALDLAEKLFDGDLDQATYEEHLRYMGGIKAYPLFTIDKLVSTVIKHIHTVNGDAKCQDLLTLLEKDRAKEITTQRQQIAYRMEAEAIIGADDPLYRLEWIPEFHSLSMQLLGKGDLTLDDAYGSEAKMHSSWVASYALIASTEGVGAQVKAPLLKRNRVLSAAEDPQEFDLLPGLEVKVAPDSYQLKFVANTEDYLHRLRPESDPVDELALDSSRQQRFKSWLDKAITEPQSMPEGEVVEEVAIAEAEGDVSMEM